MSKMLVPEATAQLGRAVVRSLFEKLKPEDIIVLVKMPLKLRALKIHRAAEKLRTA